MIGIGAGMIASDAEVHQVEERRRAEFAVNVEMITKTIPAAEGELTEVYLVDEEDALEVEDSMEEILAKVRAAT
jgi:hypothetical protein